MTMQRHWTCPRCDASMVVSIGERLEHEAVCQASNITGMCYNSSLFTSLVPEAPLLSSKGGEFITQIGKDVFIPSNSNIFVAISRGESEKGLSVYK